MISPARNMPDVASASAWARQLQACRGEGAREGKEREKETKEGCEDKEKGKEGEEAKSGSV